jgi:hypothetical protein
MLRSKCISIILAVFCGLAMQFQASGANAQVQYGCMNGICYAFVTPTYFLYTGGPALCSPNGNCLVMADNNSQTQDGKPGNGQLQMFSLFGDLLWTSEADGAGFSDYLAFQSDGNLVIYQNGGSAIWRTGTTNWNGDPGAYLAVQDDGNLVIYDAYLNPVWAATHQSNYNSYAGYLVRQYCGC